MPLSILIFCFLDLAWNSVIYDIALSCKQLWTIDAKKCRCLIFVENSFLLKFGQKELKNKVFCIFWKCCHFFSWKQFKMKILLILDFSLQTLCLEKLLVWSNYPCFWPIRLQDSLKCTISRKKWVIKLICILQINIRVSHKLLLSVLVDVAMHIQSTQNNKFAKSL